MNQEARNLAEETLTSQYESDAASVESSLDPNYIDPDTDALLDKYFGNDPSADASDSAIVDAQVEQSEESPGVEETAPEDQAEESPSEDEDVDVDEEDSPLEGEQHIIDLSDLTDEDVFEFDIHGKTVHWNKTELLNQLKRSESASQKSREVIEEREQLNMEKQQLLAERQKLAQQSTVANISPELAKAQQVEASLLHKYNTAIDEENSLDLPLIQAKLQKAQQVRVSLEQTQQQHMTQLRSQHIASQKAILAQNGMDHILKDGQNSPTMKYMQTALPPEAFNMAGLDAHLTMMAEKARLWDEAQNPKSKVKPKRTANKSLRGGRAINKPVTQSNQQPREAIAQGGYLDPDTDAFLDKYFAGR